MESLIKGKIQIGVVNGKPMAKKKSSHSKTSTEQMSNITKSDSTDETHRNYSANTMGITRKPPKVIHVSKANEIPQVLEDARRQGLSIYPISTGNNWGYGSTLAVDEDSVILDLSQLNQISEINEELGYVTLGPGVTQQQLFDELQSRGLKLMVPTTGAGPNCSILGNALEKGYGITPHQNHAETIVSVKAYLPNGLCYQSTLSQVGQGGIDKIYNNDIGMNLTPLFCQSNLGIVTEATIRLAKQPEIVGGFIFLIKDEVPSSELIVALRKLKENLGHFLGGVNLMNSARVLGMVAADEDDLAQNILDVSKEAKLKKKYQITNWTGAGAIYCPQFMSKQIKKMIKQALRPHVDRLVFFDRRRLKVANLLLSWGLLAKCSKLTGIRSQVKKLFEMLDILEGKPSLAAMKLPYLYSKKKSESDSMDPAADRCGLLWYSPLIPFQPEKIHQFIKDTIEVCRDHKVPPMITLTSISETLFDSTIPILFSQDDPHHRETAYNCFDSLWEINKKNGMIPYRVSVAHMDKYKDLKGADQEILRRIKNTFDPENILSPGRYE